MKHLPSIWFAIFCFIFVPIEFVSGAPTTVWNKTASVNWSGSRLRESLARFAEAQQIGFVLDRRIDPSIEIEFEADKVPIKDLLSEFAKSLGLECCFLDSVVYLGPKTATRPLSEILEKQRKEIEKLPSKMRAVYLRKNEFESPFLENPAKILSALAAVNGLQWKSLEPLAHDLWDEWKLPPTPLYELLALLLIGFDGTYEISDEGRTLNLVPIHSGTPFPVPVRPEPKKSISAAPPRQVNAEPAGGSSSPVPGIPLSQRRFTVKVKDQRLDDILHSLSTRFGLKLEIDEQSLAAKGVALDSRVSFDVKNATAAELLRSCLAPLKLRFQLKKDSIRID